MECKKRISCFILSMIYFVCTFLTDRRVFVGEPSEHIVYYFFCKVLLLIAIYFIISSLYEVLVKRNQYISSIIFYAVPYFIVLMMVFLKVHPFEYYGDELNIYNKVMEYNIYPHHFTYLQGLYWIISLMLIPIKMGPIIIKIIFQAIVCGYIITRGYRILNSKWVYLVYIPFMLPPTITYSYQVHRMQIYGVVYLLLIAKLFFDYWEKKKGNWIDIIIVTVLISMLTYWRREGIYLLILGVFFIIRAYAIKRKNELVKVLLAFLAIQFVFAVPNIYDEYSNNNLDAGAEKINTYLAYYFHMSRCGLDKEKHKEEIDAINMRWNVEVLDLLNEEYGDQSYAGFPWGVYDINQKGYNQEIEKLYRDAVKNLIFKEPFIFLKTRWQAWCFATNHGIDLYWVNYNGILESWKAITANLWFPFVGIVVAFIYSLVKRKSLLFWSMGGVIIHTIGTTIFMPSSYFKYYYEMYLVGWFVIMMGIIYINVRNKLK